MSADLQPETTSPAPLSPLAQMQAAITAALPSQVLSSSIVRGELALSVVPAKIVDVVRHLVEDDALQFVCFIDLTVVDYPAREDRFEVVLHLLSPHFNQRIRVKYTTDEDTPVPSLTGVFPSADWYEREAYDMFGVIFSGHPDLRRMLTDYGFDGHPLRKDFPMTGYVEVRWDDAEKRVVYEPVRLAQEYRQFDFLSPWEGDTPYTLPGDEKAKGHETAKGQEKGQG